MNGSGLALGVDIGGQSVKLGLVDSTGLVRFRAQEPVERTCTSRQLTDVIAGQTALLRDQAGEASCRIDSAGIVMPGYMDRRRTRLLYSANLPALSGSDFIAEVRGALDLPTVFDADCNAAAVAEARYGAGVQSDRLIVVTVGTGIGAGVLIDGQILRLRNHIAGSLGHVIVDANGPVCACGARGCVEALAAGPAIEKRAARLAQRVPESPLAGRLAAEGHVTCRDIADALLEDDPVAAKAVHESGWWLGVACASWSVIYDPHLILLAGGVAALGTPLLYAVREGFVEVGQTAMADQVVIDLATLGPDAGVIGAATIARQAVDQR